MNYSIKMKRTINDPAERAARLDLLYRIFSRGNETRAAGTRQDDTATQVNDQQAEAGRHEGV